MTVEVYQEEIKRTMPDLGTLNKNVEHMDLGIITEVSEILDAVKKNFAYGKPLDLVNIGEETADVAWYAGNKSTLSDIVLNQSQIDMAYERFFEGHIAEVKASEDDEEKRIFVRGLCINILNGTITDSEQDMFRSPAIVFAALRAICEIYGMDFPEQLDKNIAKLRARFPDKFDADKAINRDTDAERKILEK